MEIDNKIIQDELLIEKVKKPRFSLGKNPTARVYLKRSHSNVFITITDLKGKVIKCHSSGSAIQLCRSKRIKKSPQAIESIIRGLVPTFNIYKIKLVNIYLRSRISVFFHYLVKELEYYNIKLNCIVIKRRHPHNGVRGRKKRRL